MAGITKIVTPLAILAFGIAQPALAQTPASSLAATAPRAAAVTRDSAADPMARWLCAGGLEMEVRPLSYDGAVASREWVVVYKRDGAAYSAERIDAKAAQAFEAASCRKSKLVG
jgi:hypothetical protein